MLPLPSIEHDIINSAMDNDDDELQPGQKPKTLPCRYCQKRFRRLEHVQRHERTHTKEKPFRCGCGKTFGRRDLLVRHEKLVHLNESSRDARNASISASSASQYNPQHHVPPPPHPPQTNHQMGTPSLLSVPSLIDPDLLMAQPPSYAGRTPGCSLDLLSDAANHLASEGMRNVPTTLPQMAESRHEMHYGAGNGPDSRYEDPSGSNPDFSGMGGPSGVLEDYNLFLDDVGGMSNYFLPSSAFDSDLPVSFWSKPDLMHSAGHADGRDRQGRDTPGAESNSFSRFGSRLPSLQPEQQGEENGARNDGAGRNGPPWKVSGQDLREIQRKLDDFSDVLPKSFQLPSRHTLSRFLEGYFNGFHDHLPFLHLPSINAAALGPDLLLALAAIGAQYRFESHRGNEFWYAAKAVAIEQVRRRNSQQVADILSPIDPAMDAMSMSPQLSSRMHDSQSQDFRHGSTAESEQAQNDPRLKTAWARLETIQALLLLMGMGTWAPRALLREALSLQSIIALLIREQGLIDIDSSSESLSWEDWIKIEGDKRTKFIAYCFFNLHSIAYDMPPLLLTSEMTMCLPQSVQGWKAESAAAWLAIRRQAPPINIPFHSVLDRLFAKPPGSVANTQGPGMNSLGNYIIIHAIIQQIFFARQTSSISYPSTAHNGLLPQTQDELGQALKMWQSNWELTPESSLDPSNPYGPVAFNSTALLRLAYIRLHSDLGPCRRLDTRDPIRIAEALKGARLLERGSRLSRAVLQSAHALSIPVKIGVRYVARTQMFSWSIQHGLCNLECAFLLSKWLETIACSALDLSADEKNLLEMVRSMLDETEFAVEIKPWASAGTASREAEEARNAIKRLGAAVVRLWAETFKGTHVFAIVRVVGTALDVYAELLERECV